MFFSINLTSVLVSTVFLQYRFRVHMQDVVIGFVGCLNGWILAVTRPDTLDEPHPFTESDTITLRQLCVSSAVSNALKRGF